MRLGQPPRAGQEWAGADLRRSRRALVKDEFEQALIDFGRQRVRMMRRLRLPYRGELLLDQRAAGVEIIAVALGVFAGFGAQTGADARDRVGVGRGGAALVEEFAEGP